MRQQIPQEQYVSNVPSGYNQVSYRRFSNLIVGKPTTNWLQSMNNQRLVNPGSVNATQKLRQRPIFSMQQQQHRMHNQSVRKVSANSSRVTIVISPDLFTEHRHESFDAVTSWCKYARRQPTNDDHLSTAPTYITNDAIWHGNTHAPEYGWHVTTATKHR